MKIKKFKLMNKKIKIKIHKKEIKLYSLLKNKNNNFNLKKKKIVFNKKIKVKMISCPLYIICKEFLKFH